MADISTIELKELVARDHDLRRLLESCAEQYADKRFLHAAGTDLSYAELATLADRGSAALLRRGIERGDAVALMMKNSVEWLATWFAATQIGAVIVPVNVAYRGHGLVHILNDSHARLLFVDADLLPQVDPVMDELTYLGQVIVHDTSGIAPSGMETMAEFLDEPAVHPAPINLRTKDPAAILYTSGTTGPAKGCVLPHGQYVAAAHQMRANLEYGESDILYSCLPLFHINAQNYSVLCAWAAGATLVLDSKFTAGGFWQRLIDTEATAFNIIGGIPLMLWNQPESPLDRQHRARVAFGVPVPVEIWEAWEQRFGVRIVYAYGMTENGLPTVFPYTQTPAAPHLRGSGGRASASAEVAIVDDDDQPLPPGTIGEVVTRPKISNTMMTEYFNNPAATAEALRNCWFHTGDLGYLDDEGYFFYVDRKKDAMRRRGEMVSSWDVEAVLRSFPGIADCAAYGVPSELGEDEIMAAVVLEPGTQLDHRKLHDFCRERMAPFQVPRYIRTVSALPRTQTERVEKYKLRAEGITTNTWDAGGRS